MKQVESEDFSKVIPEDSGESSSPFEETLELLSSCHIDVKYEETERERERVHSRPLLTQIRFEKQRHEQICFKTIKAARCGF